MAVESIAVESSSNPFEEFLRREGREGDDNWTRPSTSVTPSTADAKAKAAGVSSLIIFIY